MANRAAAAPPASLTQPGDPRLGASSRTRAARSWSRAPWSCREPSSRPCRKGSRVARTAAANPASVARSSVAHARCRAPVARPQLGHVRRRLPRGHARTTGAGGRSSRSASGEGRSIELARPSRRTTTYWRPNHGPETSSRGSQAAAARKVVGAIAPARIAARTSPARHGEFSMAAAAAATPSLRATVRRSSGQRRGSGGAIVAGRGMSDRHARRWATCRGRPRRPERRPALQHRPSSRPTGPERLFTRFGECVAPGATLRARPATTRPAGKQPAQASYSGCSSTSLGRGDLHVAAGLAWLGHRRAWPEAPRSSVPQTQSHAEPSRRAPPADMPAPHAPCPLGPHEHLVDAHVRRLTDRVEDQRRRCPRRAAGRRRRSAWRSARGSPGGCGRELGGDRSGLDQRHANAERRRLLAQRLRECADAELRQVVHAGARRARRARRRS